MKKIDDIQDDELRVIGHSITSDTGRKSKAKFWALCAGVVIAFLVVVAIILTGKSEVGHVAEVFDPSAAMAPEEKIIETPWLGDYTDTTGRAYTEHIQRTVNDIVLDIYIPHNAQPQLVIGSPDIHDERIVMTTQAADIRADNGKINGAFVLAGEPKAWGLSKKGYVAIIRDSVHIGVADSSPLFEEATENGGYFFRQYALVDNGTLVENKPKNKAIRKAICDRGGEIIVVMSQTQESFHDFAQALEDFGVDNAVYLVGADSDGYYRDYNGQFTQIHKNRKRVEPKYKNYIKWVEYEPE